MENRSKIKKTTLAFLISLALLIVFSIINWSVMTAGGKVKIQSISLTGADGQVYSFVLYMPKSATSENPAPVFATYHGNSGIARNQEAWCLELSRRGFICITSEVGGGGESTITTDRNAGSTHASAALEYVLSLKNADPTRLVTAGHSNGSVILTSTNPLWLGSLRTRVPLAANKPML